MTNLAKENRRLRQALRSITKAYVEVIDLFIQCSMENIGLTPKK